MPKKKAKKAIKPKTKINVGVKADPVDEPTKEDVVGFKGGLPLNLSHELPSKKSLHDVLAHHIDEVLSQEIKNQEERIDDIIEWQRQYKGYREPRNYPFEKAANTAVPMTRSAADTVYVRLEDTLYGRKKIFLIRPQIEGIADIAHDIEEGLEWYLRHKLKFKKTMRSPLMQATKTGTGIVKVDWVDEYKTVYRYATEEEKNDLDADDLFPLPGTDDKGVKRVLCTYRGPKTFGIRREDWLMSSDAAEPEEAYICGFRKDYRKAELDVKVKQGLWDEERVHNIKNPDDHTEVAKDRVEIQGKQLIKTEYEYPYVIWELWTKYDVDGDGIEDDIVVWFHKDSKQIVRGIYNPLFRGFRPFTLIKGYPTEYAGDGEGVCEILYKLQLEMDTLHNQRIDRMTELNAPLVYVRRGCGLDDYKINPGHVEVVDEDLDASIRIEHFSNVYFSTEREEMMVQDYGYRAVGIAPENLGQTVSDRPVFKEAMARLQEANKKFQSLRDNVIASYQDIGEKLIEYFGQYQPEYKYIEKVVDETGEEDFQEQTVEFPMEAIWTGLKVELEAASQIMNVDMRREINMTVYNLLSDYMTNSAGMVQAITSQETPSEFKKWLIEQYGIGVTVVRRILEDFDQQDAESMALALEKVVDINAAIQNSVDLLPPPPPETPTNGGGQEAGGPMPAPQGGMPFPTA